MNFTKSMNYRSMDFPIHEFMKSWFHESMILRYWIHSPITLMFHHFSAIWSTKATDTDLSSFQAFTSFTNPRIHKSTSSLIYESTNPRINHPIWVCLPLHTVCCQPHFAHCTREDVNETYGTVHCFASVPELQKLALCCFASVKCFVIWFTFS